MTDEQFMELSKYHYAERGQEEPYGVDCWELVMRYYDIVLGIKLEDFLAIYDEDCPYAPLDKALEKAPEFGWKQVSEPQQHDVIITQFRDLRTHAGIVISTFPVVRFMHVHIGGRVITESANEGSWKERLIGYFRNLEVSPCQ